MGKILISGLINIETTLKVDGFPLGYSPVRYPFFGITSTVSGVGYNLAKAMTTLGDQILLLSLIGSGFQGEHIYRSLADANIPSKYVLSNLRQTPQSVILFDPGGRRQIHVDLKDIQSLSYPEDIFTEALADCDIALMCNINFSRTYLSKVISAGIPIATDVHSISNIDDEYNRDFMSAAEIIFCSNELLPCSPEKWAEQTFNRFAARILVIGLGGDGAFLSTRDGRIQARIPAFYTRPVVNTIGAGDALFSCFIHYYIQTHDPLLSLKKAMVFASYKIGDNGAAEGFLSEQQLEVFCRDYHDINH
jgi:sugar/nucleoside kinase (ribokinase family)